MVLTMPRHNVRISVNRGTVHNLAVTHVQDAMPVGGGFGIVRDHDDGLAEILIKLAEQAEDSFGTFWYRGCRWVHRPKRFLAR